jgi:hypothetical protein
MGKPKPIAVRRLRKRPQGTVTIALYPPEPAPGTPPGKWQCRFRIAGIHTSGTQLSYGVDQFSALAGALELIRLSLEPAAKTLSWEIGPEGDLGFPRVLLNALGVPFSQRLNEVIDREIVKHVGRLKKRATKRLNSDRVPKKRQSSKR